jgi:hypothetical protein
MVLGWFHIDKPSAVLDQKKIEIISARLLAPPGALSSFTKVVVLPFHRNLYRRFAVRRKWTPLRYRSKFSQQGSKARNFGGLARARARLGCKNS